MSVGKKGTWMQHFQVLQLDVIGDNDYAQCAGVPLQSLQPRKKKLLLSCQDLQAALLDADALPNYHIVISDIRLSIDRLPSQGKMSGG